jgi:hypothetical protein
MLTKDIVQANLDVAAWPPHIVAHRYKQTRQTLKQHTVDWRHSYPVALTKLMPYFIALKRAALGRPVYLKPV